ncbi:uncharacterized protein B0I36DRAFT_315073 [Microdochium trichocladiopsis]|uniref:Uncharacterized protein n=1 Tax=Microdochium trichocladiopsis TaxID=1682393 RepID=A0A9P8YFA3_9PEZI|nr:uncharacterized protein B0I36DRAFT_315073 [Microdochium trichocladiopsis]KAH7037926.1 hypothetical protein B0I36DRAFT_315073 [Microdochium trichocladiopsis]
MSSTERLNSWRYYIRVTTSNTMLTDLGTSKSVTFAQSFVDVGVAHEFLKRHLEKQVEVDQDCICKHMNGNQVSKGRTYPDKLKEKQARKRRPTECVLKKVLLPLHKYPVYEKQHHDGRFIYWYVDVEVDRGLVPSQETQNERNSARGNAIPRYKTLGLYVVSGQVYTALSIDPHHEGHHGGYRPAASLPRMRMTRLPTSVWTMETFANEAAFALISAHTKVNATDRDDNDANAWRNLIQPALEQAWFRTRTEDAPVFECTLDIPDVLRDRLGYDAISVEVEMKYSRFVLYGSSFSVPGVDRTTCRVTP